MTQSSINKPGTALITGASSGIGAIYADRMAKRGHDLVLVARDLQRLETLAVRLRNETGVKVETLQADLTQKPALLHVEERLRNDDRITTLVNNAGIAVLGEFAGQDIDKVDTMIQLNVLAPTRLAHAIAGRLAEAGGGAIINIGSVVALMPETFSGAYAATKAFVLNLSLTLNQELSGSGVRVQAVLPGATRTEIWERSGVDVNGFPPEMLMGVEDLVDAALAGFDSGETVTIPSLPDVTEWEALTAARLHLGPNLSRNAPAERYRQGIAAKA